jgi:hypothetical protein
VILIILKLIISVRGGHCYYSDLAPKILATPLMIIIHYKLSDVWSEKGSTYTDASEPYFSWKTHSCIPPYISTVESSLCGVNTGAHILLASLFMCAQFS